MEKYSYHIFMFPFRWRIQGYEDKTFSEQISLNNILYSSSSNWTRQVTTDVESENDDLYNERNYFYEFVHDALYDKGSDRSLVRHFERNEPKHSNVSYVINCSQKVYELKVEAINLNLYSSGVGVLSFYLVNDKYPEPVDVLRINQVGRRIAPPFIDSVKHRGIIANSIEIVGLQGCESGYYEDFNRYTNQTGSNEPASFVTALIREVAQNIRLKPVVDDRMFVHCWYGNDEWADELSGERYEQFVLGSSWYEYVFVDEMNECSCRNDKMHQALIEQATYSRWQQNKSLYGISRYSLVYLTNVSVWDVLLRNFITMYARISELILVQKASVLQFSSEVKDISNMEVKSGFGDKVSSLYKEYIRFINQIHFREISAQDQGIELYEMLYKTMGLERQVEKLDAEIGELYNYVTLREDRKGNHTMSQLTWIATIAVPITAVAGIFGMNNVAFTGDSEGQLVNWYNFALPQFVVMLLVTLIVFIGIFLIKNKRIR